MSWLRICLFVSVWFCVEAAADEPVIGGPCDGCEHVFEGLPKQLRSNARIAPVDEAGESMIIEGTVSEESGRAIEGIIVYAYQTDATGVYPRSITPHGRLRGWARTDENGRYRFETIRPGAYPDNDIPQHVHMHVIEPGRVTYYIDDILFEDDPLLTSSYLRRSQKGRGGKGLVRLRQDDQGKWHVRRNITLGMNIPGYKRRAMEPIQ